MKHHGGESDDRVYIYTKFITLPNGQRIYAKQYGLTAFRILVKRK